MSFNPFETFSKAFDSWQSVTDASVQRTVAAVEQLTKLTRANLTAQRELGEELHKLAVAPWTAAPR